VVFQRAKQLQNGARPRVDAGNHKPTRVALMEVLADTVSWSAT
jgi:DNA-directed RNA polymerase subunit K/omega